MHAWTASSLSARLVLNLLKSRDTIAVLHAVVYTFRRISCLAIANIFECVKTVNVFM